MIYNKVLLYIVPLFLSTISYNGSAEESKLQIEATTTSHKDSLDMSPQKAKTQSAKTQRPPKKDSDSTAGAQTEAKDKSSKQDGSDGTLSARITDLDQQIKVLKDSNSWLYYIIYAIVGFCLFICFVIIRLFRGTQPSKKTHKHPTASPQSEESLPHNHDERSISDLRDTMDEVIHEQQRTDQKLQELAARITNIEDILRRLQPPKMPEPPTPVTPSTTEYYYIKGIPSKDEGELLPTPDANSKLCITSKGELQLRPNLSPDTKQTLISNIGDTPLLQKTGTGASIAEWKPGKVNINLQTNTWKLIEPITLILKGE